MVQLKAMLKAMLKLPLLWGTLGMLGEPKAGDNPKGNYEEEARVPQPGNGEPSRAPTVVQSTDSICNSKNPFSRLGIKVRCLERHRAQIISVTEMMDLWRILFGETLVRF